MRKWQMPCERLSPKTDRFFRREYEEKEDSHKRESSFFIFGCGSFYHLFKFLVGLIYADADEKPVESVSDESDSDV